MGRFALVLWFGLFMTQAAAQNREVRSGEHDVFTRLVVPVVEGADWTLHRDQDRYVLQVSTLAATYDLTTVFDRIPRTRITALQHEESRNALVISIGCAPCHADAFLWQADRLVIDIVDGAPPPESPFEKPPEVARPDPPLDLPLTTGVDLPVALPTATGQTPTVDMVATEQAILESVARATSQGLLVIAQPSPNDEAPASPPPESVQVRVTSDEVTRDGNTADGQPGIRLRTSFDLAFPHIETSVLSDQGDICLDADVFDLAAWSAGGNFNVDIGAQRTALTEEFDRIPPTAPEDLARSYIYYGFGREAVQALSLDGIRSKSREMLVEMAVIVDGGVVPNGLLSAQLGCDGPGALWAALAVETLADQPTGVNRNAVLFAYRSLPEGLRGHLGAILASRFLEIDDTDTAALILQTVDHAITGDTQSAALAEADLALRLGNAAGAVSHLVAATGTQGRPTPENLIELMTLALAQDRHLDQATFDLVEAVRFEHRNQEIAATLGVVQARMMAHDGQIMPALTIANQVADRIEESTRIALASEIITYAVELLPDADFMTLVFDNLPPEIDATTENTVAARLLALRFPDRAAQLLLADTAQDAMRERRYLRASASIALEKPDDALRAIAGMTDPRASRLRAQALIARGDLGGAIAAGQIASPESDQDPSLAWRAGAWERLATATDPLLRDVSQRMLSGPVAGVGEPTLASRQILLEQSGETRTLVQDLLERFPVEADEITGLAN